MSGAALVMALLVGCSNSSSPTQELDTSAFQARIMGLPYPEARNLIVAEGWRPRITHLEGPDGAEREWLSARYFLEKGYVEVQLCSGTSLDNCLFNFIRTTGECLQAATSGERESATVSFAQSRCVD